MAYLPSHLQIEWQDFFRRQWQLHERFLLGVALGLDIPNFKPFVATPNTSSSELVTTFSLAPFTTATYYGKPFSHPRPQPVFYGILLIKTRLRELWPPGALLQRYRWGLRWDSTAAFSLHSAQTFPRLEQSTSHRVLHPDCERPP